MDKKGIILQVNGDSIKDEIPKQQIKMTCYTIYLYEKFNWFHRLMVKILLGLKIENVGVDK